MNQLILLIKNLLGFGKGHERTNRAKKNITASFIIKGLSVIISLVLVPLTIDYLNPTKYGIWITLSSIITWIGFFDIGLGHGLRNRFAEALASGNHKLAKTYVSTTYAILSLIVTGILILFYLVNPLLNWNLILNAGDVVSKEELSLLALIVFTFFCLQFIFKLITTLLTADQQPAKASFFDFFAKFLSLGIIYILTKITSGSIIYLGLIISGLPVLVLVVTSLWLYNSKYKLYRPDLKTIDFSKAKDLLNLGVKFFIIQISAILIFQTNSIIIAQIIGPEEVTKYNIAFKYFGINTMISGIILIPLWSAYTEAWVKKDLQWIKNSIKKMQYVWLLLTALTIIMLIFSTPIYKFWIGNSVKISFQLSFSMALYVIILGWNYIYVQFINGIGRIRLQLYSGIFGGIINIPLAIYLGKMLGVKGVVLSSCILGLINTSWTFIQYKKLIDNRATGIWGK